MIIFVVCLRERSTNRYYLTISWAFTTYRSVKAHQIDPPRDLIISKGSQYFTLWAWHASGIRILFFDSGAGCSRVTTVRSCALAKATSELSATLRNSFLAVCLYWSLFCAQLATVSKAATLSAVKGLKYSFLSATHCASSSLPAMSSL